MSAAAAAERESADGFCDGFDPLDRGSFSSGGPSSVLRAILVGVLITTTSATSSLPSFSNSDASVNSERSPSPPTAATFLPRAGDRGDQAEATRVARLPGMFRGSPDWSMLGARASSSASGGPRPPGRARGKRAAGGSPAIPGANPGAARRDRATFRGRRFVIRAQNIANRASRPRRFRVLSAIRDALVQVVRRGRLRLKILRLGVRERVRRARRVNLRPSATRFAARRRGVSPAARRCPWRDPPLSTRGSRAPRLSRPFPPRRRPARPPPSPASTALSRRCRRGLGDACASARCRRRGARRGGPRRVRRGRVPHPGDVPGVGARASRVQRRVHARARERGAEQAPREEHARARERPAALPGAAHVRAGRETLGSRRRSATQISRESRTRSRRDDRLAVRPLERPFADRTSARSEHAHESTRVSARRRTTTAAAGRTRVAL